jgi:hypothetical protein
MNLAKFNLQLDYTTVITFNAREDNIKMDLQKVGRGCGDWM